MTKCVCVHPVPARRPRLSRASHSAAAEPAKLELKKGDHVCVIGNTLAERMQHDGWLETLIHAALPGARAGLPRPRLLRRRGAARPAAAVAELRHAGRVARRHLAAAAQGSQASAENRFAGTNTQGRRDLRVLRLQRVVRRRGGAAAVQEGPGRDAQAHARAEVQRQVGAADRAVLAHRLRGPRRRRTCPTAPNSNKRLKLYTDAMAEVAKANNVVVRRPVHADARSCSRSRRRAVHDQRRPPQRAGQLSSSRRSSIDALFGRGRIRRAAERSRSSSEAVSDKNWHWFHRYRTTDGYSNFGGRGGAHVHRTTRATTIVLQRESEILDVMTSNRDKRDLGRRAGQGPGKVDDSNTPPLIPVKTNKPGTNPDGTHMFLTGEEAIEHMKLGPGPEGEPVRVGGAVPRARRARADGVRHEGPAVGGGVGDVPALHPQAAR